MFGTDRNQLRQMYKTTWDKFLQKETLSALESQIAVVIQEHPEYHDFVVQIDKEFLPELGQANPFLHMGLHLGIRDQIETNRPQGIKHIFEQLASIMGSAHDAEHRMIDCLAEAMWSSQSNNQPPDEEKYLTCLQALLTKKQ